MAEHFADRLLAAIQAKGSPVCVGVDPVYDRLPDELRQADDSPVARAAAIRDFSLRLLDVVAPIVPAVKPQIAYFEVYREHGLKAYFDVVAHARELGLIVIGDIKRGDIGPTAAAYAVGHLAGPDAPDAVTVNGYFGADGLQPFADQAAANGQGLFVLVRTSNPSSARVQDFEDAAGAKFYEHMARVVAEFAQEPALLGQCGYSCVGAVVGATWPDEARRLREIMPRQIFLVPGYGAQGATAQDCAASFKDDGTGAIVNASRSVIFAYREKQYAGKDWLEAVQQAALAFATDIRKAVMP